MTIVYVGKIIGIINKRHREKKIRDATGSDLMAREAQTTKKIIEDEDRSRNI